MQSKLYGYNDKLYCDIAATEQSLKNTQQFLEKFENNLDSKIKAILLNYKLEHEMCKDILQTGPRIMLEECLQKVTYNFVDEIQKRLIPSLISRLDDIKEQFHVDIDKQISSSNNTLHDSIIQVCSSKVNSFSSIIKFLYKIKNMYLIT